jgi:hypothetical protein
MKATLQKRLARTLALVVLWLILGAAGVKLLHQLGTNVNGRLPETSRGVTAMEHLCDALQRIDSSFRLTLADQEPKARIQYEANWKTYRENLRVEQEVLISPQEKGLVHELTALSVQYEQQGKTFYLNSANDRRRHAEYFDSGGLHETFIRIRSVAGQLSRKEPER